MTIEGISESDTYFAAMGDGVEDAFFNFCKMYLRPDGVALDIGANIGITAALLSQCLTHGHVHAFEPAKTVFPILDRNIKANDFQNVMVYDTAFGDKIGIAYFVDQSAYGHLTESACGHEVEVLTVDKFVNSSSLQRLDFIKIDVEGYEPFVINGAASAIKTFNPLIYMEFNSWCLTTHSRVNPLTFVEQIFDTFADVHVVAKNQPTFFCKSWPSPMPSIFCKRT